MSTNGNSDPSSENISQKALLEKKLQALRGEVKSTEKELNTLRLGETVVDVLNEGIHLDRVKALLSEVHGNFEFELIWDVERKIFRAGSIRLGGRAPESSESDSGHDSFIRKPIPRKRRNPLSSKPPQEEDYFVPILQVLRHFGWSATPEQITPLVEDKMRHRLSDEDFERISSGMFIRWEARMRFARKRMVDREPPLLNPNAPRGIWEATEAGKLYLEEMERGKP